MPDRPDEETPPDAQKGQSTIHFDLRFEPWLPIVRSDGSRAEVGLLEVLVRAHEMREIRDPLPPVECGMVRLLVALALDIFEPEGAHAWREVWRAGRFDQERVSKYLEAHADRFDLFGARPFLQSGDAEGEDKPLAGLLPSQPSGTNALHFHHGSEQEFAVAPEVAARLLCAISPFMTAGGAGLAPSINGAPPWYVLLQGQNLFETIWLNVPVLEDLLFAASGDGPPAWRDERPVAKEERGHASLLEALTWRPRRIRLVPHLAPQAGARCALSGRASTVLVGRMKFAPGASTRFEWRDPHVPYRIGKDGALVMRPREGREVWRDVGALALLRHSDQAGKDVAFERPAVVTQFAAFVREGHLPKDTPLRLAMYGMRTDLKMKVFEWHREALSLPAPLVLNRHFLSHTQGEMRLAEDVAYALAVAIKKTYPREGKGNDKAFDALIARAHSSFWNRLHPLYLSRPDSLLERLALLDPESDKAQIQAAVGAWRLQLKAVARQVLEAAIGGLDTDALAIRRAIEARQQFEGRLWALLNPEAAAKAREKKKVKGTTQGATP